VAGGTASELAGGSFANGARSAAFQQLFNEAMHAVAKDMIPSKFIVLRGKTQNKIYYTKYYYQLENKEGESLTGSGYSAEEHIKTIYTKGAPVNKIVSTKYLLLRNGMLEDTIGLSFSPRNNVNINYMVHQTFTIKYQREIYHLSTVFAHHIQISEGIAVYMTTTTVVP